MHVQDPPRRRRRGPKPLDAEAKRDYTVSVRLNVAEQTQLDAERAKARLPRGEFLRTAALGRPRPAVPELNRVAWGALALTAEHIDRIAKSLGDEGFNAIEARAAISAFRLALIGARGTT